MKTKKLGTVMLFWNGGIAALDDNGRQIVKLQRKTAIDLVLEQAVSLGYDVIGCKVTTLQNTMRVIEGRRGPELTIWNP